ncbi:hypothetical protein BDY21DRAFT_342899 [Lineolata rhizophorae]|uniref:Uncharacterized protein n=1 Tax=Lineolata rhizophorae TaxID=578093 RepID=A0A6A6P1X3_9PEZI|nr:hypothetical protein BDY21DRAFT_342899 [Lineolata rhizophorae]
MLSSNTSDPGRPDKSFRSGLLGSSNYSRVYSPRNIFQPIISLDLLWKVGSLAL